jgi:uncharacterized surface protein with fasciclin (FAS1) repeats
MHGFFDQNWFGRTGLLLLIGLATLLGGCGEREPTEAAGDARDVTVTANTMTVDRVLRTDDRFSTLVATLDSTDLDSTLASEGPYTLFAPPNAAFEALPEGTLEVLLADRTGRLSTILTHHVVDGHVSTTDLAGTTALRTLSGDSLRIRRDSALTVGAATVVEGDIPGANGVIHVIDRVLRPPAPDQE